MSAVMSIAALLALAAVVVTAVEALVRLTAIKALRSLAEVPCGTAEAKTRRAIAFGDMITRVAVERRPTVGQWCGLLVRSQSRPEANEKVPGPSASDIAGVVTRRSPPGWDRA